MQPVLIHVCQDRRGVAAARPSPRRSLGLKGCVGGKQAAWYERAQKQLLPAASLNINLPRPHLAAAEFFASGLPVALPVTSLEALVLRWAGCSRETAGEMRCSSHVPKPSCIGTSYLPVSSEILADIAVSCGRSSSPSQSLRCLSLAGIPQLGYQTCKHDVRGKTASFSLQFQKFRPCKG